ncbi:DUF1338 domain-containing protein [Aliikangiella maris]|uniref:2-oxoadipate dioxygenase/decarboxylase n=2 Tax=Aliikangiella maris TaxID=3162458 RepID=A0ABV3MTC6_9GAMM
MANQQNIEQLFENMWQDYLALNPDALKIFQLFEQKDTVVNDHVALRTYGVPGLTVEEIAKPLINAGYQSAGEYDFAQKKLRAQHFTHPDMPLVFISELKVEEFSATVQSIIAELVSQMDMSVIAQPDFLYSGRHWEISYETYQKLLAESEYAAWVAAFGFRPNHFTVSINHLTQFENISAVNQFLKDNGFALNTSGGEIKGTPASFLEQSSTMANSVEVTFSDCKKQIPSCFYEFAQRHKMANGEIFKGFIASSADKIFESTDSKAA